MSTAEGVQARAALQSMDKYRSIASLQKHEKIEALKSPSVNPIRLGEAGDPYAGLAAAFHKWTLVAKNGEGLPPDKKAAVARGYYEKMLLPLYTKLGVSPMAPGLWEQEAWNKEGALNYKVENAYSNLVSILHGTAALTQDFANMGATGINMLGYFLKDNWAAAKAVGGMVAHPSQGMPQDWVDRVINAANGHEGVFDRAKRETSSMPLLGAISKYLSQRHGEFWEESVPMQGFRQKATSLVTEMIPQLALFKGLAVANEAAVGVTGLTELLSKVKGGKLIAQSLLAGTENLAYGLMVRDQDDKNAAIKDGIYGFAITTLLSSITKGGGKIWSALQKDSAKAAALGEKASEATERFKSGKREATAAEYDKEFKKDAANTMSVAGPLGQEAVDEHGLELALGWEQRGLSAKEIRNERVRLSKKDPALHNPALSAATKIQKFTKGQKLSEIVADPKKLELLRTQLKALRMDAAAEMQEHVAGMQQQSAASAATRAREPGAGPTREMVKAKILKDPQIASAVQSGVIKPEDLEKHVDQEYGKQVAKAQDFASKKANNIRNATRNATEVGKKRTALAKRVSDQAETRTAFMGGSAHASAIQMAWKNYTEGLRRAFSKSGVKDISFDQYVKDSVTDMDDHDFSSLLHEFLPPQIKDAGLFFEKAQHGENPNLMAFLYNYASQLPKPLNEAIRDRLMETTKTALSMPKNHMMTEGQLQFYARTVYNHVDNFVGSTRFEKGERNIFRSTSPKMVDQSKWMKEQLVERQMADQSHLKRMFGKYPQQMQTALKTLDGFYQGLYRLNDAQFAGKPDPKLPLNFKHASDELADWLIKQSELKESRQRLERWNFDFEGGE